MAELKTKLNKSSVTAFIDKVPDPKRREDCRAVLKIMEEATKAKPEMWGTSIVGFGRYHYKYASGREGDWMLMGFSPRKDNLTLYILPGLESFPELMEKLGKFKTGKSCLYIKNLDDLNLNVLKRLVKMSVEKLAKHRVDKPRA